MIIRSITEQDWPQIMAIQAACYTEVTPEPLSAMRSKWLASADTCWVIENSLQVCGYALSHPWYKGQAAKLNIETPAQVNGDCLYLHDMAISPEAQGSGAGKMLMTQLINHSKTLNVLGIGLVAVQGANTYWQRFGFKQSSDTQPLLQSLQGYPQDTVYLWLDINA